MIRLRVLGALDCRDERGQALDTLLAQPKLCAILAYLAVATRGAFHRRDTLLAMFWPELDSEHARSALSKAIHALRRELGRDAINSRGDNELALNGGRVWCDAASMDERLNQGDSSGGLELYGGPLLDGLHIKDAPDFERWVDQERARLAERASGAALLLAEAAYNRGAFMDATAYARRALQIIPLEEPALRQLMLALHGGGQRLKALKAFDDFAAHLWETLEVTPSTETRALAERIRLDPEGGDVPPSATLVGDPVSAQSVGVQPLGWRSRYPSRRIAFVSLALAVALVLAGSAWLQPAVIEVMGLERERRAPGTPRSRARELYALGMEARRRPNSEGKQEAIRHFRAAIEADSTYAEAFAALALEYAAGGLQGGVPLPQGEPMAEVLARRALALDSTLFVPHVARGVSRFLVQWDWPGSIASFQQALRLNPNAVGAYLYMSQVLAATGRFAEAEAAMRRMLQVQAVNPSHVTAGLVLFHLRRYSDATRQFELAIDADSSYANAFLFASRPYLLSGRYQDYARVMVAWARLTRMVDPGEMERMALGLGSPAGRRESLLILERWRKAKPPPLALYDFARVYAHLGKREEALKCLEEAYAQRAIGIYSLAVEPHMDPLRGEPRFQALLDSMRLPTLPAQSR